MADYEVEYPLTGNMMVIDAIRQAQEKDSTVTFRRSCAQGVCGSDGVNMNGKNGLACITPVADVITRDKLEVRPLPGLPVIKDLIVDMKPFYEQYEKVKPFLDNEEEVTTGHERLQSPDDRDKLDGLYECVLCACCSTSCPSFWWNPDKFVGPAALLQAYSFIADTRDKQKNNFMRVVVISSIICNIFLNLLYVLIPSGCHYCDWMRKYLRWFVYVNALEVSSIIGLATFHSPE